MKFRRTNAKQTRGPNAKDLVLQAMEQPVSKGKKACIHGGVETNLKKTNATKKPPRTKETKEKEVREHKRDAFLLFLTTSDDNENVKEQK